VFGGWESTGIISFASGLPFSATTTGVDPGGLGLLNTSSASNAYPDMVADPNKGAPHTAASWFNPDAFVLVPAGVYRPGNARPNTIIGPGYETWDLTLIKNQRLPREANLTFRLEAFNALNHTNYSAVNAIIGNAAYNQVTAAGSKRVVQLGAKLTF
jgi:hypothetical protein